MLNLGDLLPKRVFQRSSLQATEGRHYLKRARRRLLQIEALEEKVVLATFAIIGDYGSAGPGEQAVSDMVKSWNPDSILTLGDNNYEVGSAATIDANIGQYYHEYIGNYQGSYGPGSPTNRFFPILGNHDWQTTGAQPYLDYFTLPGNERYYDFVVDNVHFFALDSDPHEPDGVTSDSTQALWLRDSLASSQETFNVVLLHHAPYTSGDPTYNMRWPFDDWGADVILAGHQHQYERLDIDGVPYFVNGLGGAEIKSFGSPAAGSQVRYNADYGAMRLVTSSTALEFEFLSVDGTLVDSYTLNAAAGSNDDFADAALLQGVSVSTSGDNFGATFEPSEPYNVGSTGGSSVWWSWTAPSSGIATVATAGSNFDTTLGVYTGPSVSSLTKVASDDDVSSSDLTSELSFSAIENQTYRISVDGYDGATGSIALQLDFEETDLPENDAFSARTVLTGANVTATGASVQATTEPGEPKNAGIAGGKSLWWSWTAESSGSVTFSTAGSSFDTTLGIYTGSSVNALTPVAANDDERSSILTSLVTLQAIAGVTYQISVDGYQGASGQVQLAVVADSNNNFSDRIPLSGSNLTVSGSNLGGSLESGEQTNAGVPGGKSVWWSWTAPVSGSVSVSTAGSSFDTTLGIYTGSSVNSLASVASNDDQRSSLLTSLVTFDAVAGQTYQISVDGYNGASGQISLSIVANDDFSTRIPLNGSSFSVTATNYGASLESVEQTNANVPGGKSVWWSWTAPTAGQVTLTTDGSSFDTTIGIYTGSNVSNLSGVAANDDEASSILTSRVSFSAVAGLTYQISVDGYDGASGQIVLNLDLSSGAGQAQMAGFTQSSDSSPQAFSAGQATESSFDDTDSRQGYARELRQELGLSSSNKTTSSDAPVIAGRPRSDRAVDRRRAAESRVEATQLLDDWDTALESLFR